MPSDFAMTRRVQFAETDVAGVLHFANYFRLMEEVEHAFWRSIGLSVISEEDGRRISWPRVATSCEYFAPARFEDELELGFAIENVSVQSLSYRVEFRCAGRRLAVCKATVVCCTLAAGSFQAVSIPESIRGKLTKAAPAAE